MPSDKKRPSKQQKSILTQDRTPRIIEVER